MRSSGDIEMAVVPKPTLLHQPATTTRWSRAAIAATAVGCAALLALAVTAAVFASGGTSTSIQGIGGMARGLSGMGRRLVSGDTEPGQAGIFPLEVPEPRGGNSTSGDGEQRKLRSGIKLGICDSMSPQARKDSIGASFDIVVKYQNVWNLPGQYQWLVKPHLDAGMQATLVIEFMDGYANLGAIASGAFDAPIHSFISDWKNDGNRRVGIRFMHEFNGDWYPWGTYRNGNSKVLFKKAYAHIAHIFRGRGANAELQLAYNCMNPKDAPDSFHDWYPGGDIVDIIMCSAYNRAGVDAAHQTWQSFADVFNHGYYKMNSLPGGKPLGVAETSTTDWGGHDKSQWIKDAYAAVAYQFPRVQQFNWFIINKEGDWGLNTDTQRRTFGSCIHQYINV